MTDHSDRDDHTRTHAVLGKGMMVAHYRIIDKIGAGGMGEIYLAEDTKLKRRVALKFLPTRFAADPDFKALLDHPCFDELRAKYEVGS